MDRTTALNAQPLSEIDRNTVAEKVATGELQVTLDEFGNGQIPVLVADNESKKFVEQMRKFDINQMISQKDAARKSMDEALVAYDLAAQNLESLTLFIQKLGEAKDAGKPKRPE